MGPRSDNRGYVPFQNAVSKQWQLGIASMGPRSDNRGYEDKIARADFK